MRRLVMTFGVVLCAVGMALGQAPTGFNYQALIYKEGAPVAEQSVKLEITLQDAEGEKYYVEEHAGLTTAKSGLVNVEIGGGTAQFGAMGDVRWEKGIFVAVRADVGGGYASLGAPVKLQAVPYALYAMATRAVSTPESKEKDEPIFEVVNSRGVQVLGVYEEGVRIQVSDGSLERRGPRGGFAIATTGDGMRGEPSFINRFTLADGGISLLVDEGEGLRGPRGGFAIATLGEGMRGEPSSVNRFSLGGGGVRFLVDEGSDKLRGPRGGFAIATLGEGMRGETEGTNRFALSGPSLNIMVDPTLCGPDGGFTVSHALLCGAPTDGNPTTLLHIDDRASYFTLRKDEANRSTFSLRERENNDSVIVNFTADGKLQAGDGQGENIFESAATEMEVSWQASYPDTAATFVFSNAMRWAFPYLSVRSVTGSQLYDQPYTITLNDEGKKYFEVYTLPYHNPDVRSPMLTLKKDYEIAEELLTKEEFGRICLVNAPSVCRRIHGAQFLPDWLEGNLSVSPVSEAQFYFPNPKEESVFGSLNLSVDELTVGGEPLASSPYKDQILRGVVFDVEITCSESNIQANAEFHSFEHIRLVTTKEFYEQHATAGEEEIEVSFTFKSPAFKEGEIKLEGVKIHFSY